MKVLVTGGVRSGKSTHAERLLAGEPMVTYVASAPTVEEDLDPDWAARLATHRARRPESWTTEETRDLSGAVAAAEGAVLIDCLGTWLTGVLDEAGAWEQASGDLHALVQEQLTGLVAALVASSATVVLVTNEVGLGVVPEHRSGRLFRDLLGIVNQAVAAVCDEVHLVVAGRVLTI
jgi:adenosylcobinamide kinase/adenosylcobinamide-phosphate guanylyltransferase